MSSMILAALIRCFNTDLSFFERFSTFFDINSTGTYCFKRSSIYDGSLEESIFDIKRFDNLSKKSNFTPEFTHYFLIYLFKLWTLLRMT